MNEKNNTMAAPARLRGLAGLPSTKYGLAAAAAYAVMSSPVLALAEDSNQASDAFNQIKNTISSGLTAIGAAMVVFGAVTIGMNVSGAAQGNGGAISSGIATMVGGAVIAAASILFKSITI